jgi:hypothetical protein
MSADLMDAYKNFWGSGPSDEYKKIYPTISQMFANYANRPPRVGDWNRIWQANRLAYERMGQTEGIDQAWTDPTLYDPYIAHLAPSPQIQPPVSAYQPALSF